MNSTPLNSKPLQSKLSNSRLLNPGSVRASVVRCLLLFSLLNSVFQGVVVGAPAVSADLTLPEAAKAGDAETVREALRRGEDANASQGDGMTGLHWAAKTGSVELTKMLLRAGANIEAGTRIGRYTPLHLAAQEGHADVVLALLEAGANSNAVTTAGGSRPLHLAASSASTESVGHLLDHGAEINATENAWGQTPLMFAAAYGHDQVIELLSEAGADLALTSRVFDVVPAEKADRKRRKQRAKRMAEDQDLAEQATALEAAINGVRVEKEGEGEKGEQAAEKESKDKDSKDKEKDQKLGTAAEKTAEKKPEKPKADGWGKDDADCIKPDIEALLAKGPASSGAEREDGSADRSANIRKKSQAEPGGNKPSDKEPKPCGPPSYGELIGGHGGLAALHYAAREGQTAAVKALLRGGADINERSVGDLTSPLLYAVINGHFDLAGELVDAGADVKLVNHAGATPLHAVLDSQWAPKAGYPQQGAHKQQATTYLELIEKLLDAGADPNARLLKHLWYASYNFDLLLDLTGATPFWRAAYATDVPAMRLLFEHGADPMQPTIHMPGRPVTSNPLEEEEELLRKKREKEDPSGLPPVEVGDPALFALHAASGAGYGEKFSAQSHNHVPDAWLPAMRYLVEEQGMDVNMRDDNGLTPLHHAASRGDMKSVIYLLFRGADVHAVSRSGQTTADMANGPQQRVQPFPETLDLLVALGAKNSGKCVSC